MLPELFDSAIIVSVLAATVRIATPILFAALGELVVERGGIYNMGLEGTMLMGAFAAYYAAYQSGSLWIGVLFGMLMGLSFSAIFALMTITLKIEQIIVGLALNLLGSGLSVFWLRSAFAQAGMSPAIVNFDTVPIPILSQIPWLGPILFDQKILTYIAFGMVPAIWLFLFRTRQGLELRSIGENPKALDIRGRSVALRQYCAVLFGGAMAGLGGAFLTVGSSARFVPEMTNGRGWLALVVVIAGIWRPGRILVAVLVFSLIDAIQLQIQAVGTRLPYQILLALPYICALAALIVRRGRISAPAMLGIAYRRE